MKPAPNRAATTVASRGVLALVVLTVGLLCLFGRASGPSHVVQADGVSVSQVTAGVSSAAADDTAPCGKKTAVSESVAHRADAAVSDTVEAVGVVADRRDHPVLDAGFSLPNGPAPPPPASLCSVLRM